MTRPTAAILFFVCAGITSLSSAREPTSLEQYYLELVNRARLAPNAEVTRLSGETWGDSGSPVAPDLNEGLTPGTISATTKQPLAFDSRLIDSASDYSDLLLRTEQFTHYANGDPGSRMTSSGYVFNAPSAGGENLSITTTTAINPLNATVVELHHLNLFIDGDVTGRGHRKGILNNSFREVGIAIRSDSDSDSFFGPPFINDIVSTQDFAASAGRIFVTGVIYYDNNINSFYEPGESAGILDLAVKNPGGTTVASGTSFASGGYSINMAGKAAGNYTLFATDSEGDVDSVDFVWDGTINVKADLIDPAFLAPPILGVPFRPDASIGKALTKLNGNDFYGDSASKQSVKQKALTKKPLFWSVRFENDGSEEDNVRISGPLGSRLFRVTVKQKDGGTSKNVTAGMKAGLLETLQTGQQTDFVIKVKPGKKALGSRTGFSFQFRGVSANEPSKVDRVNGKLINRTKAPGL